MNNQLTYASVWPYQSKRYKTVIHLLLQSPTTLFAYWNIPEQRKQFIAEHYHTQWHMLTKQARLVSTSKLPQLAHPTRYWDVAVGESEVWYFRDVSPNTTYRMDYGILNSYNQFITLCCSNVITSPRIEDTLGCNPSTFTQKDDPCTLTSMKQVQVSNSVIASSLSFAPRDHSPFPQFSTYSLYTSMDLVQVSKPIERN